MRASGAGIETADDIWRRAQAAEAQFWDWVVADAGEFRRITAEKRDCIELVKRHVPEAFRPRSRTPHLAVEIGIGPLAVGLGSFLEPANEWRLIGLEPQARRERSRGSMSSTCRALQARTAGYVQAKGEAAGLRSDTFDLAFCYNVIDHTPNWRGILNEAYRMLKPGGYLVLTVDTLCLASYLRWVCILRRFARSDFNVIAHPSRFTAFQLERLLSQFGFEQLWTERDSAEFRRRILGDARRLSAVARKPSSDCARMTGARALAAS